MIIKNEADALKYLSEMNTEQFSDTFKQAIQVSIDCLKNKIENKKPNIIELPCEIGDLVEYSYNTKNLIFEVQKIVMDDDGEVRIYGDENQRCITYASNFDKYCKVLRKRNETV